jgi:hypothetical protein
VAEATAADIGKTSKFYTCGEKRLAESTAGRFLCVPSMFDSLEVKVLFTA